MRLLLVLFWFGLLLPGAGAVQPDEMLQDQRLESRARELSRELRCMVCQNQSIDDSDAPLARDLRILVRERLTKGDSDRQVIEYLTARYGNFILLKPPFDSQTMLLWLFPVAFIAMSGIFLLLMARRQARGNDLEEKLTSTEEARLANVRPPSPQ